MDHVTPAGLNVDIRSSQVSSRNSRVAHHAFVWQSFSSACILDLGIRHLTLSRPHFESTQSYLPAYLLQTLLSRLGKWSFAHGSMKLVHCIDRSCGLVSARVPSKRSLSPHQMCLLSNKMPKCLSAAVSGCKMALVGVLNAQF